MLSLWTHPKTKVARLYVSTSILRKATKAVGGKWRYKDTKVWFESGDSGEVEISVQVPSEDVSDQKLAEFQEAVLDAEGLDGKEAWDELVSRSENPAPESEGLAKSEPAKPSSADKTSHPRKRLSEARKLDIAKVSIESRVTIEIDARESKLVENLLKAHPMISVRRSNIGMADFRIRDASGNELLIERKRCTGDGHRTDFEHAVQEGSRLFHESDRLRFIADQSDHQVVPVLLLEGDVHDNARTMSISQIDGAISVLSAVHRLSIINTYNVSHSAFLIAKLASKFSEGDFARPLPAHRNKPKALLEQKLHVLESLPGIRKVTAEALLEKFGSIAAVAAANEEELSKVSGVGAKRAKDILRVLGRLI
jgi:Fanconi anemia group M protein